MKKEFGKLNKSQLKTVFAQYHEMTMERAEYKELLRTKGISGIYVNSWSHLYEIPYSVLLAKFLLLIGLGPVIIKLSTVDDPQQAWLDFSEKEFKDHEYDPESEEEKAQFLQMIQALSGHVVAIELFSMPMDALLAMAETGDDEKLFNAVYADRCVLNTKSIAKRIAFAELHQDRNFFVLLSKSITQTRPRRPLEDYDALRYMLEVIAENDDLANYPLKKLDETLCQEFELHNSDFENTFEALKKLIQRRNKSVGNSKGYQSSPTPK